MVEVADQSSWVRVECGGIDWWVAPVPVAPVGIGEARYIAEQNGCELPSPELVDAIWAAADLKLQPLPRRHDGTPRTMSSQETYADQAAKIWAQVAGRPFTLLAGTHKDVVMHNGRIGLYGWHQANGQVIQPFYGGHALAWKDYSQGVRLCLRA